VHFTKQKLWLVNPEGFLLCSLKPTPMKEIEIDSFAHRTYPPQFAQWHLGYQQDNPEWKYVESERFVFYLIIFNECV
jgi:hypothetical protein